jgi:hypothetical protein
MMVLGGFSPVMLAEFLTFVDPTYATAFVDSKI